MGTVREAAEALEATLRTVTGVRVYRDPGAALDPPAVVLGPPALTWESNCLEPTEARFIISAVGKADERALERFWDLGPALAVALDQVLDAAVIRADPGVWTAGAAELPAYNIQVDVAL